MNLLALDLSKRSTGWAAWPAGSDAPIYGHWVLGSQFTSDGRVFACLHRNLAELRQVVPFDFMAIEDPLHPAQLTGHTNIDTLRLLTGLAAHAESFADAVGLRGFRRINVASWRRDFIGSQKRGTKRATLKALTIERCRQLGFAPMRDDEADALGLLDYLCSLRDVVPPWRAGEVLRPMLGAASC